MSEPTGDRTDDPASGRDPHRNGDGAEATPAISGLRGWLRRLIRPRNGSETLRDTIEELIEQEDVGASADGDELALFRNILNLHGLTVDDVMVPRADVVAVAIDTSLADLVKLMGTTNHSRLPVYRETLDDVVGMVHIKDVLSYWDSKTPFRMADIIRRVLFVAPSMPILELLLQMRAQRIHMAMVVDEFGGIDGLVTIEDLVEEIVGEIEDEHDKETAPAMVTRPDGSLEMDARVEIEAFEERVGQVLTSEERAEDIDTLGGLVFFLAGRVPGRGEVIRHSTGIEFEILDADPRRIKRLRACNLPQEEAPK
jgi:hemolysin (HlyC) family protein